MSTQNINYTNLYSNLDSRYTNTSYVTTQIAAQASAQASANLSNLASASAARTNLGLGNVQNQAIIVLGPSDPVPANTPTGTVILRTS